MNFYQRLMQIQTADDIQAQMDKAKRLMMRRRAESKSPNLSLEEKVEMGRKTKADEEVLRMLRRHVFDIEDHLVAGTLACFAEQFKTVQQ